MKKILLTIIFVTQVAGTLLSQTCDEPIAVYYPMANESSVSGSNEISAQVITATISASDFFVSLELRSCKQNGLTDAQLDIVTVTAGEPDWANVIGSAIVPENEIFDIPACNQNIFGISTFSFNGVNLNAGIQYGLVLRLAPGHDPGAGLHWRRSSTPTDPSNPYTGGNLWFLDLFSNDAYEVPIVDLQFDICPSLNAVSEDFNSGMPDGWNTFVWEGNCDFEIGTDLPTGDPFPTPGIFFDDDACGNNQDLNILAINTPEYNISASTVATLTVDVAFQESGNQIFVIEVFDGPNTLAVLEIFDESLDPDIQTFTYDVSPYINANMHFRFTYNDDPGNTGQGSWGWHGGIDNFILNSDAALNVEENTITGFNMYPNPADEVLNISANENIDQIVVYDMLGRKIMEQSLNSTSSQINISTIAKGTYFIQVTAGNLQDSYQFVKK